MSYSLHYFIRKTSTRYQLTQLAGNAGLHADISWVYLMEDIENTDFLRGGELVITTGMSIHSEQTLLAFAASLKRNRPADSCSMSDIISRKSLCRSSPTVTKIPCRFLRCRGKFTLPTLWSSIAMRLRSSEISAHRLRVLLRNCFFHLPQTKVHLPSLPATAVRPATPIISRQAATPSHPPRILSP